MGNPSHSMSPPAFCGSQHLTGFHLTPSWIHELTRPLWPTLHTGGFCFSSSCTHPLNLHTHHCVLCRVTGLSLAQARVWPILLQNNPLGRQDTLPGSKYHQSKLPQTDSLSQCSRVHLKMIPEAMQTDPRCESMVQQDMDRWRADTGGGRKPVAEVGTDADKRREKHGRICTLSPWPQLLGPSTSANVKSLSFPENPENTQEWV